MEWRVRREEGSWRKDGKKDRSGIRFRLDRLRRRDIVKTGKGLLGDNLQEKQITLHSFITY